MHFINELFTKNTAEKEPLEVLKREVELDNVKKSEKKQKSQEDRKEELFKLSNYLVDFVDKALEAQSKKTFAKAVEILKKGKIKEILIAGEIDKDMKNGPGHIMDLDTRLSLMLLSDFNNKEDQEFYDEGASISIHNKNELDENYRNYEDGVKIVVDAGGRWLSVEGHLDKTILYIDHHGSGKREDTSGAKTTFELMKEAGILKEEAWMKDFVNFVTNIDNLSYLYKKDKNGKDIFDEKYLLDNWTKSLYAFAEHDMSFEDLFDLYKNNKINTNSEYLSNDEINSEIGDIKLNIKDVKDLKTMSLREGIIFKREQVKNSIRSAKNIIKYNEENNLIIENNSLGKVFYQNFNSKFKVANGRSITNIIDNRLAYKVINAMGYDTYIVFNKQKGYYFFNSSSTDLDLIAEDINSEYPNSAQEKRGVFIFGKIPENMTEDKFIKILSKKRVAKKSVDSV